MKITNRYWIIFCLLACLGGATWMTFGYPRLAFVNLSLNKKQALNKAREDLIQRGYDLDGFEGVAISSLDEHANRYLQRTIGFKALKNFIKKHDFDMFFWIIRFFKEKEKEEFRLAVSAATGQIISFRHIIPDTAPKPSLTKDEAKDNIVQFLIKTFDFKKESYTFKQESQLSYENRDEFSCAWQKKDVHIPWTEEAGNGVGKLIISATISGDEILSFSKNIFEVPDAFTRDIERRKDLGENLGSLTRILYYVLLAAAIFFIIVRRNHLAMQITKKFYLGLAILFFILTIADNINYFDHILFYYNTAVPLTSHFWQYSMDSLLAAIIISLAFLLPGLSGELLHHELYKETHPGGAFLHYLRSTFLSRQVFQAIILGYLFCLILLGVQSALIKIGQTYLGVWVEQSWMNNFPTSFIPFLAALTLGLKVSFREEIFYRLFTFSWMKKILKNTLGAVVVASIIWGFAHSHYPIFPKWFRGLEVSCLGLLFSFFYLKFGIIPVIIAHYLFDVFWNSAAFLFGKSHPFYFYSSFGILILPLLFGVAAFWINQKETLAPMRWHLNKKQLYNLEILKTYLLTKKDHLFKEKDRDQIRKEISTHGWDISLIDTALEDIT